MAQSIVLILAYTIPAIFLSMPLTGNPLPQLGVGSNMVGQDVSLPAKRVAGVVAVVAVISVLFGHLDYHSWTAITASTIRCKFCHFCQFRPVTARPFQVGQTQWLNASASLVEVALLGVRRRACRWPCLGLRDRQPL